MGRWIAGRLVGSVPTLLLVSFIAFLLIYIAPGDPAYLIAGENASPDKVAEVQRQLGLDDPFFTRFFSWLSKTVTGDLGVSLYNRLPVVTLIGQRLPATLSLVLLSMIIAIVIGTTLGMVAGLHPNGALDRLVTAVASFSVAIPPFLFGLVLLTLFTDLWSALPVGDYEPLSNGVIEWLRHLILPSFTLAVPAIAEIARQMRAGVIDVTHRDFVRTADAKGLSPSVIAVKHIARNGAIPVVTVMGLQVARLFGSAIVVESVFNIPGIGSLLVNSVFQRDFTVIQGLVVVTGAVTVVANLLADVSYGWLDPRIRRV